jgi:hypothetical protein
MIHGQRVLPPCLLLAIDAATGATRWTREIDGLPAAWAASPAATALLIHRGGAPGELVSFDAGGALLRKSALATPFDAAPEGKRASVVAMDGPHVLLWERGALRCEETGGGGRTMWEVPLPGKSPDIVLAEGAICARSGRTLTVLG